MQQEAVFSFSFSHVDKEHILKEILSVDSAKDIPAYIFTKIIKHNADIFSDFLLSGFKNSITSFNRALNKQLLHQLLSKETKIGRKTIG